MVLAREFHRPRDDESRFNQHEVNAAIRSLQGSFKALETSNLRLQQASSKQRGRILTQFLAVHAMQRAAAEKALGYDCRELFKGVRGKKARFPRDDGDESDSDSESDDATASGSSSSVMTEPSDATAEEETAPGDGISSPGRPASPRAGFWTTEASPSHGGAVRRDSPAYAPKRHGPSQCNPQQHAGGSPVDAASMTAAPLALHGAWGTPARPTSGGLTPRVWANVSPKRPFSAPRMQRYGGTKAVGSNCPDAQRAAGRVSPLPVFGLLDGGSRTAAWRSAAVAAPSPPPPTAPPLPGQRADGSNAAAFGGLKGGKAAREAARGATPVAGQSPSATMLLARRAEYWRHASRSRAAPGAHGGRGA